MTQSPIERTLTSQPTGPAIYSHPLVRRKTCPAEICQAECALLRHLDSLGPDTPMSFCSQTTAISNCLLGEHSSSVPLSSCGRQDISISEYSTSGGLSEWPSRMSLPYVVLSGPSEINKAHPTDCLCGEPSRLAFASLLTDLLFGVYSPPTVRSSE